MSRDNLEPTIPGLRNGKEFTLQRQDFFYRESCGHLLSFRGSGRNTDGFISELLSIRSAPRLNSFDHKKGKCFLKKSKTFLFFEASDFLEISYCCLTPRRSELFYSCLDRREGGIDLAKVSLIFCKQNGVIGDK
jgi:hypothetical protein